MEKSVTVQDVMLKKSNGEPLVMVTAYDYTMARIIGGSDVDMILVGDSAANVMGGADTTCEATMEQMLYHTRCVSRAKPGALVIGDMPFLSYQTGVRDAVLNAGRFLRESGANAVKLEGGRRVIDQVRAIVAADIPVMGHLGLTPQSVHALSGYKVQGRTKDAAKELLKEALLLQEAGVFGIVLECVPTPVAREVTEKLDVPTIGIGAGPYTSGQVLVIQDLLGMNQDFKPKFVKRYADLYTSITEAVNTYAAEVRGGTYPDEEHSFSK